MTRINGANLPYKFSEKRWIGTASTTFTSSNSVAITKLASVFVTASYFKINDILTVTSAITKTGVNGTCSFYLYINDTDSLTTPTLLGRYSSFVTNGINFLFQRRLAIDNPTGAGNGTIIMNSSTPAINDLAVSGTGHGATGGGFQYVPINWGTASYIIVAGAVRSTSDSIKAISLQITT